MLGFKDFFEEQDFVKFVLNEFDNHQPQLGQEVKPWSAKKVEIIGTWRNLRPDVPILMTPISKKTGEGAETYGEDGIRISGSWPFISSVLGKLKELLAYENPHSKLRLVFRSVDTNPARKSYIFYINLETRGSGKPGRPRKNTLPKLI